MSDRILNDSLEKLVLSMFRESLHTILMGLVAKIEGLKRNERAL